MWIRTTNNLEGERNPSKSWRHFDKLIGKSTSTTYPILTDNSAPHTDIENSNIFADSLQTVLTPE